MAETPCGSVHESPVRGQRTRPTLKAVVPSLECVTENSCEANAGFYNSTVVVVSAIPTKGRLIAVSMYGERQICRIER
jgi:hypothetical protein